MTLEEEIDRYLDTERSVASWNSIKEWRWDGRPESSTSISWGFAVADVQQEVEYMIIVAPLEECLTSPAEYIREYRKWVEARNGS